MWTFGLGLELTTWPMFAQAWSAMESAWYVDVWACVCGLGLITLCARLM